jgi:hypothetical protein
LARQRELQEKIAALGALTDKPCLKLGDVRHADKTSPFGLRAANGAAVTWCWVADLTGSATCTYDREQCFEIVKLRAARPAVSRQG